MGTRAVSWGGRIKARSQFAPSTLGVRQVGVRSERTTRGATEATQYGREGQDGHVGSADWQGVQSMGSSYV